MPTELWTFCSCSASGHRPIALCAGHYHLQKQQNQRHTSRTVLCTARLSCQKTPAIGSSGCIAPQIGIHLSFSHWPLAFFRCSAQTQDPCLFRWALGHWPTGTPFSTTRPWPFQVGKQAICQILCSARSTRPSLLKVGNRPQAKPELRLPQQDPRRLVGTTRPLAKPQKQELCLPQAISHLSALHKTKTLASTVGTQRPLAKQDPCLLVGTLKTSLHTSATSQTGTGQN